MLLSVQYMRAIAAVLVVVHHVAWKAEQYSNDPLYWFRVGGVGVDLFFIISGFIMCYTTTSRIVRADQFIKARIRRIIPIYWLLTVVALCAFLIAPEKVNSSGGSTTILNSFILLPSSSKYLVQNGWTLSYEFLFYGIFACGLLLPGTVRLIIPKTILMGLVLIGIITPQATTFGRFCTNPLLLNFVMGIVAFELLNRKPVKKIPAVISILTSIIALTCINFGYSSGIRVLDYAVPSLLFFVGMVSLEGFFNAKRDFRLARVFERIGDSSYSLYLLHPFVLVPGAISLRFLGVNYFGSLFSIILVALSLCAGWFCYRWIEQPLYRRLR